MCVYSFLHLFKSLYYAEEHCNVHSFSSLLFDTLRWLGICKVRYQTVTEYELQRVKKMITGLSAWLGMLIDL